MKQPETRGQTLESGRFFGRCIREVKGREFGFYEYQYSPGMSIPNHGHQHALVSFLVSGDYVERFGTNERVSPQRAVYHPPQEEHCQFFGEKGARLFGFEIPDYLIEYLKDSTALIHDPHDGLGVLDAAAMMRMIRLSSDRSILGIFAAEATALGLLAALPLRRNSVSERRKPKWICRAQDLLDSDSDFSLKLSSVSLLLGLCPTYVSREFRRWQGCSVGEYVIRRRVAAALEEIRNSDTEFSSIAASIGFADHSHLSRAIKQVSGMTPGELRRHTRVSKGSKDGR